MCAYQNYIMIFGFLKTMSMWQTSSIVVCNTSWEARTAFSKSFNFPKSNYAYNHSITFFARFCNLYVNCSIFEECWNFEIWRKMLVVWLLPQDRLLSPCWGVWTISIDIENLNFTIFFWYAHIWHEFHIFQGPVKCAWWVISKCAYIIRYQAMHISQIVASEFLYMFHLSKFQMFFGKVENQSRFRGEGVLSYQWFPFLWSNFTV